MLRLRSVQTFYENYCQTRFSPVRLVADRSIDACTLPRAEPGRMGLENAILDCSINCIMSNWVKKCCPSSAHATQSDRLEYACARCAQVLTDEDLRVGQCPRCAP